MCGGGEHRGCRHDRHFTIRSNFSGREYRADREAHRRQDNDRADSGSRAAF
jgi:hypothetical protein